MGGENVWRIYSFQAFGRKSWANDRSAKRLLATTLNGFSLANCRRFAKVAKLLTRQTPDYVCD